MWKLTPESRFLKNADGFLEAGARRDEGGCDVGKHRLQVRVKQQDVIRIRDPRRTSMIEQANGLLAFAVTRELWSDTQRCRLPSRKWSIAARHLNKPLRT